MNGHDMVNDSSDRETLVSLSSDSAVYRLVNKAKRNKDRRYRTAGLSKVTRNSLDQVRCGCQSELNFNPAPHNTTMEEAMVSLGPRTPRGRVDVHIILMGFAENGILYIYSRSCQVERRMSLHSRPINYFQA